MTKEQHGNSRDDRRLAAMGAPRASIFLLFYTLGLLLLCLIPILFKPKDIYIVILAIGPILYAAFHYERRVYQFMILLAVLSETTVALLAAEDLIGALVMIALVAFPITILAEMSHNLIVNQLHVKQALEHSEQRYRGLFEKSPVSLWDEDFSMVKDLIDELKASGVSDFHEYLSARPGEVRRLMEAMQIIDANEAALSLSDLSSMNDLFPHLEEIFHSGPLDGYIEELCAIAQRRLHFQWEGPADMVDGKVRYHSITWAVAPGAEQKFDRVIVAIVDVTKAKQAEEALLYISSRDTLTSLYNRAYFEAEMNRLRDSRLYPISIFFADIDGLKKINDSHGHEAGDLLLQHAAALLRASFRVEDIVARIGGDEFGVLLPGAGTETAAALLERVRAAMETYNRREPDAKVSFSMGMATAKKGEDLQSVLRAADAAMYREKERKRK